MERKHTVLLADDEEIVRTLVRATLEGPGYEIVEASSGADALDLVGTTKPDVLICDVMMPGMNGLDLVARVRQERGPHTLPVIMLTASGQRRHREQSRRLGVTGYLVKPFSPLKLLRMVEESCRQVELESCAILAPSASAGVPRSPARDSEPDAQLALYIRDLKTTIDAERMRTDELRDAHARLLALDRLKDEFLSFITHELRTPLGHMGALRLVSVSADPQDQQGMFEIALRGLERLEVFVTRGLEYFDWLGAANVSTEARTDLRDLIAAVASEHPELHAPAGDFHLKCEGGPCIVRGEPNHLTQVVRTLLTNAVEFCAGRANVTVTLTLQDRTALLRVRDRGQGIPAEHADEIFNPFAVAGAHRSSQRTGLSLVLAKTIIERHGGTMKAHSDGPGAGAIFVVELPLADAGTGCAPVLGRRAQLSKGRDGVLEPRFDHARA